MNILEFIFAIFCLAVAFILIVGGMALKYDNVRLQEENEKLKEDLKKARIRKVKSEYKKVKNVKEEK